MSRPDRARLQRVLRNIDVEPSTLRRDPLGQTWLPADVRRLVRRCPECRSDLRVFVEAELALFDDADLGPDPFFTNRVMRQLPKPMPMTSSSARQRVLVLALFHTLAGAMAYVSFWILAPQQLLTWLDRAHGWVDVGIGMAAPWASLAAMCCALAGVVALLVPRGHTSSA